MQAPKRMPEVALLGFSLIAGAVFFTLTNPREVHPILLVAAFLPLALTFYSLASLGLKFFKLDKKSGGVRYAGLLGVLTLLPTILVALQSIGQLTLVDALMLLLLFTAGYFYMNRLVGVRL